MFKSFGKASPTKENVIGLSNRKEKESDVQVEVSLDVFDKLYSIVVTENASLQSVVSVPTAETLKRSRKNQVSSCNVSRRLSGTSRPSANSIRSIHTSPSTIKTFRSRGRETSSCPPPTNRGSSEKTLTTTSTTQHRETSCPPPSTRRSDLEGKKNAPAPCNAGKKSKDLVSKTVSRNRLFGARRKSQVVPTARI
jgi:hypothetical protein